MAEPTGAKTIGDLVKEVAEFMGIAYHGAGGNEAAMVPIDEHDLENAWRKTDILIKLLHCDYEFEVRHLFFSGAKGFHIFIPSQAFGIFDSCNSLHIIFKNICRCNTIGVCSWY